MNKARMLELWREWKSKIVFTISHIVGRLRSPHQTISVWPDKSVDLAERVALFMHFDGFGAVRPQIFIYLKQLAENGRSVVFVTNSEKLLPNAEAKLREICSCIIIRRNIGYDFGAWRDAIDQLALPRANTRELIICNDSVFGPIRRLDDTLDRLDYEEADVWGMTESWQRRYHLQSYFIAFGPAALASTAFGKFWRNVLPAPAKSFIIHKYEIGLTQAMLLGGLRCSALWSYEMLLKQVNQDELNQFLALETKDAGKTDPVILVRRLHILRIRDAIARRMALNPTSDLWRQLLLSGYPFIKRELLRDNPTRVEDVGDWADMLKTTLEADPDPIRAELRLMLKGGAP
ncbi:MAG: lipopolysaccharide biosynthesis protein [Rhodospirillales bacterium 20-60-12]|nr:MAG: lipopolysaccharide biosynthesis protein [Rhodospirillales bacterium 20-60-12]HQT66434.1 rhamnan synthesis F family protein [Acetobacteraceae bacterium]